MRNVAGLTAHDIQERLNHITATDVAAIMGTSPWKTRYDLYLEKCVELKPLEPSPAMIWGSMMEPVILQFAEMILREHHRRPDLKVTKNGCRRRHGNDVMSCTLDARVVGLPEAVEAKTHAAIHGHVDLSEWGQPWTDEVPAWYRDQVCAQLACAPDLERVWIVLSVGRMMPAFYCVERAQHVARIAEIETSVCDFWDQHIAPNIPPGDSEPTLDTARRINVPTQEEMAVALPDHLLERRVKVNTLKNRLEKMQERLDALIRTNLAGAIKGETPKGHQVRLTTYHRKEYGVKAADVTRMDVRIRPPLPLR